MYEEFINKAYTYAIVGASNNPEKYGHRILKDLNGAGYKVIPVNLNESEILGIKAFPNLKELFSENEINKNEFVVDFVIPPQAVIEVLNEVKELGLKKVWLQPGCESDEAINFCKDNGIECIHGACIMIERRKLDAGIQ